MLYPGCVNSSSKGGNDFQHLAVAKKTQTKMYYETRSGKNRLLKPMRVYVHIHICIHYKKIYMGG